jgi:hypothetical protein
VGTALQKAASWEPNKLIRSANLSHVLIKATAFAMMIFFVLLIPDNLGLFGFGFCCCGYRSI